jgi:Protein of unknown function (DUF1364)
MFPKTTAHRNPNLLAMARGKDCLMRVPGVCNHNPETVVAAHSNSGMHGKAGARKADDEYSVWACSACHSWLDQGAGARNREIGQRTFVQALLRQAREWARIAYDPLCKAKDRDAAAWALEQLQKPRAPEGVVIEHGFLKGN